jgi:hypothetical protein
MCHLFRFVFATGFAIEIKSLKIQLTLELILKYHGRRVYSLVHMRVENQTTVEESVESHLSAIP